MSVAMNQMLIVRTESGDTRVLNYDVGVSELQPADRIVSFYGLYWSFESF